MELPMCAVFDRKLSLWDKPITVRHNGEAIREWDIVRADNNTRIGKNPSDFELYQIGIFDDETGAAQAIKPVHLASGV